jgi:PPOX class probable F420-dependent enzyme
MDDAHIAQRLTDERIVWFGSTRPDSRPHQVPVWFWWQDPDLVAFSMAAAQKLCNINYEPAVALHLDSADGSDIVLAEGTARIVGGDDVARLVDGFAGKYSKLLGPGGMAAWRSTFTVPILVTVTRVVAWTRTSGGLAFRTVP